jgi:ABC-2 type transport system ATP-binding protein
MIAAELEHVSKRFGPVAALDNVSFRLSEGEALALLGPNGAGKSTAIAVLLGLRRPDSGTARLFGLDPRQPRARRAVGVTPQETSFPATLRVRELVELVRSHFAGPVPADRLYARFGLRGLEGRQLGGLSGGERRRVAVALAFAGGPRLVVLDEPTSGLDRDARLSVWEAIRAHAADGGALLLTTHHLEEADALAERLLLVESGRIVADGTIAEVKTASGLTVVRVRAGPDAELAVEGLEGIERDGAYLRLVCRDGAEAVQRLESAGIPLRELEVRPMTLEEALVARAHAPSRAGGRSR